jgi:hypothetical protein
MCIPRLRRLPALGFDRPHQPEYAPFTLETWERNLEVLLDFARNRPEQLRRDCLDHFRLNCGVAEVTVEVAPPGSAQIQLNSSRLTSFPWTGICFRDYPVAFTAVPRPGYRFVGWSGVEGNLPALEQTLEGEYTEVIARFEPTALNPPAWPSVIVTEFQYHPAAEPDSGDWLELRNRGDAIRLYDPTGEWMLNLVYSDREPWPSEADGTGYTLQLKDPDLFAVDPSAWTFSNTLGGTPGGPGL